MAALTIRRIDESTKARLRVVAAENQRSMEEEAREILKAALSAQESGADFVMGVRAIFEPIGFVDLPEFDRGSWPQDDPPTFE